MSDQPLNQCQPGCATEPPWSISEVRSVEGEYLIVGGIGQEFGLIASCPVKADAELIVRLRNGCGVQTEHEARAEDIAIELCLSYGRDPDEPTSIMEMCDGDNQPVPTWMVYVEQAEAILEKFRVTRHAASSLSSAKLGGEK